MADWTILITALGPERLTLAEAFVLARLRWPIELLFELWKQAVALEASASEDPWRIPCEVYAKLLALLIQHGILLTAAWDQLDRSLVQAAQVVRQHTGLLIAGFAGRFSLAEILA